VLPREKLYGRRKCLMSTEETKAIARCAVELGSQPNLDALEEVYAPDVVWHEPDREIQGLEQAKEFLSQYLSAFADQTVNIEDVIAEGDKLVTRYTIRGTHQGETRSLVLPL
jgi:predicted ester cyclase